MSDHLGISACENKSISEHLDYICLTILAFLSEYVNTSV